MVPQTTIKIPEFSCGPERHSVKIVEGRQRGCWWEPLIKTIPTHTRHTSIRSRLWGRARKRGLSCGDSQDHRPHESLSRHDRDGVCRRGCDRNVWGIRGIDESTVVSWYLPNRHGKRNRGGCQANEGTDSELD
jgi:hypothetical protein